MADEDRDEGIREAILSATDHILSFVHTPAEFDGEAHPVGEAHILYERQGENLVANYDTTQIDIDRNKTVAESLQGTPVLPTSDIMTVAYYVKCFHGRLAVGQVVRAGIWFQMNDGERAEYLRALPDAPEGDRIDGLHLIGPWRLFQNSGISNFKNFGENQRYKVEHNRPFVDTQAQSVWFPGLANKLEGLPKKVKKNKALFERIQKLAKVVKPVKNMKEGDLYKPNEITPLTEYYLMRYMAPWLINQGYVEEAMPVTITDAEGKTKTILRKIDIDKAQTHEAFDTEVEQLLTSLAYESGTPIDEMFAFERIRTIYNYPEDYHETHYQEVEGNHIEGHYRQPNPKNENMDISFGILQEIYASMSPANRKSFIEQTKKWVLDTMPKRKYRRKATGREGLALGGGQTNKFLPVDNDASLKAAEAALVWVEETEDERAFQQEYTLKLPTDLSEPTKKERISEGATIVVPGIILLLAEIRGGHTFYDSIAETETTHTANLDNRQGYNYLKKLIATTQMPGLVRERDIDETVQHQTEALIQIIQNQYEGVYQPINENTARFIHMDSDGIMSTLTVDPSIIQKIIGLGKLQSEFGNFIEAEEYASDIIGGMECANIGKNTINKYRDNNGNEIEEEAVAAFAEETGLRMRKPQRFGAKAFNALGYLVEDQMIRSAQQAARTTKMPKSSDFDKMVAALIGSPKHPGLAVSHAALHFQKLYVQMRSPIAKWNIIEEERFAEGTFLALESFLDNPALKALYWMLNERGYISIGNFTGTRPTFFQVPKSKASSEATFTGLQNAFASVVIGYYRLLFAQIRQRIVFVRSGAEGAKSGPETIDLKKYWKELMKDASVSAPDPAIFGTVLRFFSQGDRGVKPVIRIPTWMPVMPESLRDAKESKGDPNMVINYLKWAYGSDPVDMENFAEVAAAYHSAKALSYHTDYPHMVERFVNAVAEDKGSAFLFSILLNESQPDLSPERIEGTRVDVGMVSFMDGAVNQGRQQAVQEILGGERPPQNEGAGEAMEELMRRIAAFDVADNVDRNVLFDLLNEFRANVAEALENPEPNDPEASINAVIDLYDAKIEDLNLQEEADARAIKTLIDAGAVQQAIEQLREPIVPDEEE